MTNQNVATTNNPFGKQVAESTNNAVAASDSDRAIQEVQAAMVIAKKFPRDTIKAVDRILNACTRPTLAEGALYSYPRGGQEITGPSIRLAEAMTQNWGNMQFGIRELSAANGSSTVEAFAWDMETNTRQVKVFQVEHVRYSKKAGLTKLTDPRDIYEMVANQGARRLRACILGVIPGDVTEAAINQCGITQQTNIEVTPETITAMVEAFENNFGVTRELIEKRIGKHADSINANQMLSLRKIYAGLKDGISKPGDWFDIETQVEQIGPKVSEINDMLAEKKPEPAKRKAKEKAKPEPEESEPLTYAQVAGKLNEADNPAQWTAALNIMEQFLQTGDNEKFRTEMDDVRAAKQQRMTDAAKK